MVMVMAFDKSRLIYCVQCSITIIAITLFIGAVASLIRNLVVRICARSFGNKFSALVDSKITFIGVLHHEISHALVAFILGAKIVNCKLYEVKSRTLGHVDIIPRGGIVLESIQKGMCGLAPVICGILSNYALYHFFLSGLDKVEIKSFLAILLMVQISYHMSISKQDLLVALKGLPILWIVAVIIIYIVNIRFNIEDTVTFLITIGGILCINLFLALFIRIISIIFNKQ